MVYLHGGHGNILTKISGEALDGQEAGLAGRRRRWRPQDAFGSA